MSTAVNDEKEVAQNDFVEGANSKLKGSQLTSEQRACLSRCSLYQSSVSAGFDRDGKDMDPLIQREKFAVSLRKTKRESIILTKRKKTFETINNRSMTASASMQDSLREVQKEFFSEQGVCNAISSL